MQIDLVVPEDVDVMLQGVSTADSQKLRTVFLRFSQFLTWPIAFVFFHSFYSMKINGSDNLLKIRSPFIIIANHPNVTASFLFRLILGFSTPHLPLRFMAVRKFVWKWLNFLSAIGLVDFIYSLFGVFTVVPGRGIENNLVEAKRIIRSGGNVVIYPEGKIESSNVIAPFHSGASVLAKDTGVPVLPISFRVSRNRFIRQNMTINIGKAINATKDMNIQQITGLFYASIGELYGSGK